MKSLFIALLASMKKRKGEWKSLEDLMRLRTNILVLNVLQGLNITVEKATAVLKEEKDSELKKILLAAIENLSHFAVAEEYQMASELDSYDDEDDEEDEDLKDKFNLSIFKKYNETWGDIENKDVIWAGVMARKFMSYRDETILIYATQGDERVRPWHRDLEGLAYPKESFPEWLIPPIEWGCRCYLIDEDVSKYGWEEVENAMRRYNVDMEMPDWVDPVFKESLAKGGRIFSEDHKYFKINDKDADKLAKIAKRIKDSMLKNG